MSECPTVLNLRIFNHQIVANLPKNVAKKERFLKYVRILGFFQKRWVFWEKLEFFKIGKRGKFAVECVSNDIIF